MANQLSNQLLAQLFVQDSQDPFLLLFTITHPNFAAPIRLVNNGEQIISRGNTFLPFPIRVTLPTDDGETEKQVKLEMDNIGLEFIDELRSITTPATVLLEMILASIPNDVQMDIPDLKLGNISYNRSIISGTLFIDNFLNAELSAERYTPKNYPGLF